MKSLPILFLCIIVTVGQAQKASIEGLGDFPGGKFESTAQGISGDGSVVVGSGTTASGKHAFRWTSASGMVDIGDTSMKETWAYATSLDGTVVVGSGDMGKGWNAYKGFFWRKDYGFVQPAYFHELARYEFWRVSSDGTVLVGDGGQQAFRWTADSGVVSLGILPGRNSSRAISVSSDGSVVIGSSYNLPAWDKEEAFRWTQKDGITGLGFLPGGNISFATAVSPNGCVVVGTANDSSGYPAFRWDRQSGLVRLGHLPGKNTTHPFGITYDGFVIVGSSFKNRNSGTAFIWDQKNGIRPLQNVLASDYGMEPAGWDLQAATGISYDGKVIVGWGKNPSGNQEAFRIILK